MADTDASATHLRLATPKTGAEPVAASPRRRLQGPGTFLLLALSLLLTGCGSSEQHGAASTPLPAPPATLQDNQGNLTQDAARYLYLAEGRLVAQCMADAGYKYVVREPPDQALAGASTANYGRLSVATARRHGYRPPSRLNDAVSQFVSADPNQAYLASLSQSQRQDYPVALFGHDDTRITINLPDGESITTNRGGCTSQARRLLYGPDLATWLRNQFIANNMNLEVHRRVTTDPVYLKAVNEWQTCMKGRHQVFTTPEAARQAAARSRSGDEAGSTPAAAEIAIAMADAECQRASQLVNVAEHLDHRYRTGVSAERSSEISSYRLARAEAVRRAPGLLQTR
ncbi:hypothetical protein [Streptomyces sp. NBC_01285]|uniref:hypothetical protein n=1 Tax=Streptomyces sp. NBC_01285 TaxID=2903813 RepID=UPI00225A8F44|nr:hypothetical protein [Streptomyces sp. NBC_01285]MCX4773752.1 hypothetical protein [Streptomyces sp. NBC_01285]